MASGLSFQESRIVGTGSVPRRLPVVSAGTLLVDLAAEFLRHECQHLLVQSADGELVGIVSQEQLRSAMRGWSSEEGAWHHRTVESLLSFVLDHPEGPAVPKAVSSPTPVFDSLSFYDGGDLVGLLTSEDVLLSWNRLEPALARAATDALTRLPNRNHFERRFHEEWQRAARQGLNLGLIIIDVDHFKQVNDTYGHQRGDMVLAAIAECCQRQFRSYDVVARYAGDEFIALASGCSISDIELPLTRLQQAVRGLNLTFDNQMVTTTLSIGAAVTSPHDSGQTPEALVKAADECLYHAKRNGRDQSCCVELTALLRAEG